MYRLRNMLRIQMRLHVLPKDRDIFKWKKPPKPKRNHMLLISLEYITIISFLFFSLTTKENEGMSFLAEM